MGRKEIDLLREIIARNEENNIRLISNTVSTYPKEWIVIHEVLQNAKDAIQKSNKDQGKIQIIFDLSDQRVTVSDNGRGFPYDLSLLGIGGTDKTKDDWRLAGKIGVGLKAVIFSSKSFWLESVYDCYKWSMKIHDAESYVDGKNVRLFVDEPTNTDEETHTHVSYTFSKPNVSEFLTMLWDEYASRVSNDLAASPLDKLKLAVEWYFRTYSYAGDVNRLLDLSGVKKTTTSITFRLNEEISDFLPSELNALMSDINSFEVEFENKHWDLQEAISRVRPGVPKVNSIDMDIPAGGRIGSFNENYVWIRKLVNREDFVKLLNNDIVRDKPDPGEYESLFNKTRGIYIAIGSISKMKKLNIESPRRFVCANGVPSSHDIRQPTRGGEYTLNMTIHFIMNVDTNLTYGKQTIPDRRLLGRINKFYEDAYRCTLKHIASSIVGRRPNMSSTGLEVSGEYPSEVGILDREDMPLDSLSIVKIPYNEDTLIALFYELIGKGYLEGYRTYSLYRTGRYDAKMILKLEEKEEWRIPYSDGDLDTAEFKLKTSELIKDFEDGLKLPENIRLIIVWENDFNNNIDYQVVNIENTDDSGRRLHHVKLCLQNRRTGRLIQMLVLKDLVNELAGSIN